MFLAGDEFGNTQYGNNNSYCQDNEISWLDWSRLGQYGEVFEFFKYMIEFRKKHTILRSKQEASGFGFADVSFHNEKAFDAHYTWDSRVVGVMFAGRVHEEEDAVYVGINAFWEPRKIELPKLMQGYHWKMAVDTYKGKCYEEGVEIKETQIEVGPRSVVVLYADMDD